MEQDPGRYIVGIGEALWDMLPEGRKLGGAPANFAYHVSQFDLPTYVVSAVGNDELGQEILSTLEEKGLKTIIPTVEFPTGTVEVQLNDEGVPQYDIRQGVAWDNIPFTEELKELAKKTVTVCFGTLAQRSETSRNTIQSFIKAMPEEAVKVFDVNLRGDFYSKEVLEWSMKACDVLKINDEEIERLCQMFGIEMTDPREVANTLIEDYTIEIVILTCGDKGSYIFNNEGYAMFLPAPKVEVADTVGAGDAFTAAFTSGMLCGLEINYAHKFANECAAFVCTEAGAMPQLPEHLREVIL